MTGKREAAGLADDLRKSVIGGGEEFEIKIMKLYLSNTVCLPLGKPVWAKENRKETMKGLLSW